MDKIIQITPITFPLNLGTADSLYVYGGRADGNLSNRITCLLLNRSIRPSRILAREVFILTEEQVTSNEINIDWATNYVVEQLGLTLT